MAKAKKSAIKEQPLEERILIGRVGVDSGQLMVCDPCYIDGEWENEEFNLENDHYFIFPDGKEEMVRHCSKRWFELIDRANSGELKIEERPNPDRKAKHNFSYNAISQKTIRDDYAQLHYKKGHEGVGVAFRTGFGDGYYEVYGTFREIEGWGRRMVKVEVIFISDEELDEFDEE